MKPNSALDRYITTREQSAWTTPGVRFIELTHFCNTATGARIGEYKTPVIIKTGFPTVGTKEKGNEK